VFPTRGQAWRACFGSAALLVGLAVYIFDRPSANVAVLFFGAGGGHRPHYWFGVLGNHLPDFAHAFAFALFTAVAFSGKRRWGKVWICFAWWLVDSLLELGQLPVVATAIADALQPWTRAFPLLASVSAYFVRGTFDFWDLAATLLGAVAAYGVIILTDDPPARGRAAPSLPHSRVRGFAVSAVTLLGLVSVLGSGEAGPGPNETCPAPEIKSVPPVQATVGQAYTYSISALFECHAFLTCSDTNVLLTPAEAGVFSNGQNQTTISWTPSLSEANSDVAFSVATAADYCGNSASQSWSVHVLPALPAPLVVSSVYPVDAATNVPVNSAIGSSLAAAVDPKTVTVGSFLVSGPAGPVTGNLQVKGSEVTFIPDVGLPASTLFTVTMTTAIGSTSGASLASNYVWTFSSGLGGDTTLPSVPAGLFATRVTASEVDLSWSGSTDNVAIAGYNIYRNGIQTQTVTNLASLSAADRGLDFNTAYCYTVSAFDSSANESAPSNAACVSTLDLLPGDVAAWGLTLLDGKANVADAATRTVPDLVAGIGNAIAISAEEFLTSAVTSDGAVWQWGTNSLGPVQAQNAGSAVAAASTDSQSFSIRSDGTVWGWGNNAFGQLGTGSASTPTPVQMLNMNDAVAVAAGYGHTLVLKSDGTVWATGGNWCGQLGDSTATSRPAPIEVGLNSVAAIGARNSQSVALKSDGTVWTWGGEYPSSCVFAPVQVAGISNAIGVSAGEGFLLAVEADGTVWGQGRNEFGQLGDGTNADRAAPVQVAGLAGVIAVAAGRTHSLALKADGTVWAWGSNTSGELGDGTTLDRNAPVQVLKLHDVKAIVAGEDTSRALR
jgi:alpha-tubulin suppressor-like RCC1 family protein